MPPDYACQGPEGGVHLGCVWKDSRNVRIKHDDIAALGVARRILVPATSAEIVLGKDIVSIRSAHDSRPSLCLFHSLSAPAGLLSGR